MNTSNGMQAFRAKKMECHLRKEETQVYVIGTRVPDYPSSLHLRCRIYYEFNHRYQSLQMRDNPLRLLPRCSGLSLVLYTRPYYFYHLLNKLFDRDLLLLEIKMVFHRQ